VILEVENLHATANGVEVLKGIDLFVGEGEVCALMGPNGSGKSTLAHVLAGRPDYAVTRGEVRYLGKDLLALPAEERARSGLFIGFQYPVEIPGVNNAYFLKAAVNAVRKEQGLPQYDSAEFLQVAKAKMRELGMDPKLLHRAVNADFSGGEKKRNEILQMALLEPRLAILDEIDSGLDIDALKAVADGINRLRAPNRAVILVTHYKRLLDHVRADQIHVIAGGRILKSGPPALADELEEKGYGWISQESRV
jgi:Fe-S cluster assembly ATP-binding protein